MRKFLIPRKGLIVRRPNMNQIDPQGEPVSWNGPEGKFWRRRVRSGDCRIDRAKSEALDKPVKAQKAALSQNHSNQKKKKEVDK